MNQLLSKLLKNSWIIFLVSIFSLSACSQKVKNNSNNFYIFSDTVSMKIVEGFKLYKQQLRGENLSYFILITGNDSNNKITISHCQNCNFSSIINSSSRYFKYDSILLPIIFDFDLDYSNLLKRGNDAPIAFLIGGYVIEFTKEGNIIRVGLEQ